MAIPFAGGPCRNGIEGAFLRAAGDARYLEFVADKFDLRRDIQFSSRVAAATYDESGNAWKIVPRMAVGPARSSWITAIGPLSTPTMPNIQGMESFARRGLPHGPVASSSRDLRRQAEWP